MFFKRFLKISHTFLPWGTGSTEPSFFYGFLTKHLFINLSLVCTFWYKEMHYQGPAPTMSNIAYILLVYMNGDKHISRREVPGAWDLATGEKCTQ